MGVLLLFPPPHRSVFLLYLFSTVVGEVEGHHYHHGGLQAETGDAVPSPVS